MKTLKRTALKTETFKDFMIDVRRWYRTYTRKYPQIKVWKITDYQTYYNIQKGI